MTFTGILCVYCIGMNYFDFSFYVPENGTGFNEIKIIHDMEDIHLSACLV